MDIEELQEKVIEFRDARDWAQFQSKRSEVRAPEIRGRRTAKNQKSEPQNSRATFGFASGYAVLRRTALSKLEINEKRYPVEKAKGSARKYTESRS